MIIDCCHILITCQPEHGLVGGIRRIYVCRQDGSACLSRAYSHLQGSLVECYTLHGIEQLVRPACGHTVVAVCREVECRHQRLHLGYLATCTGEPVLRAALGGYVVSLTLEIAQLRAACEHLLVAVLQHRGSGQVGRTLDALTAVEHILIAAVTQLVGRQLYMAEGVVYQFLSTGKQAIEGIGCIDFLVVFKILAFEHTHDVTVDLGLHGGLDVDVLRTVVNSTGSATGTCRDPAAQGIVHAEELHEVVFLHDDVKSPLRILGNDLFRTTVDCIDDVCRQRDAVVEGDGDLTVLLGDKRQWCVPVDPAQLLSRRDLHDDPVGTVCRRIPVLAVLIHVDGDGSLAYRPGRHLTVLIHCCHGGVIRAVGKTTLCRLGTARTGGCLTDVHHEVGGIDVK